ncbi:MAG: ABC transporter ATP-binding protein [Solitalea-like symbiont of Acarus siro]
MQVNLVSIWQKYNYNYLFKNLTLNFYRNNKYAITGANGSGKSTLIKIIASLISPTKGQVNYSINGKEILKEDTTRFLSMLPPYLEPEANLNLNEQLELYKSFRPVCNHLSIDKILDLISLTKHREQVISKLSSGMKQRLKLALAFCFKSEIILLDEPTSYLDSLGIDLYNYFIENYTENKILIIASNQKHEISCCNHVIEL